MSDINVLAGYYLEDKVFYHNAIWEDNVSGSVNLYNNGERASGIFIAIK